MKNSILFLFILLGTAMPSFGDNIDKSVTDANLVGHVISKTTGEYLPFVMVEIKGTTIGTTTDATGHYFLKNLPIGKFVVTTKKVGYKPLQQEVMVVRDSLKELNFFLEESETSLDEVVVSANRSETTQRLAPTLVNVLNAKVFEDTHATCLAEGLNFQPGVRVEDDCQNCAIPQVRINGLDGHYSQVLMDSRPVFSALNGVYALEQIPANMIDRVEVIRGGGSALFGSSAIGGVVNIITKDPIRNSAEVSYSLMSVGGSNRFDQNTTMNVSLVTDDHKAGIAVYGQSRHRSGYDDDDDGYTELPQLRTQTIGFRSFLKTGTYSKLTLQYNHITDFRRGGNLLNIPEFQANTAEQAEHDINGGGLNFDLYSPDAKNHLNTYFSFQNTERNSYSGGIGDGSDESVAAALKAYGHTRDLTLIGGAQYVHSFDRLLFMPSDLTLGAEYNYDQLNDEALGYHSTMNQWVRVGSAFAQNEWKTEQWSFLLGGRLDKNSLLDHAIVSPRANVRFNLNKSVNFRLSYSTGFRAPQTFDEDLHVDLIGGERVKTHLADKLKEEKSNSLSFSTDLYHTFGSVRTNLLIEGFYTNLKNVFAERYLSTTDADGNTILERYNGSGATVMGINIEGKAAFTKWFELQAGVTLQQSKYKEAESWSEDAVAQRKMFRSPNTYGYFTASFTPLKGFTASFSGTYTGSMLVQHVAGSGVSTDVAVNTPTFFDANFKLAYDFALASGVTMQVNAGIQNVTNAYQSDFDKGYDRDADYIYGPSLPRSYFVGTKISL